MHLGLGSPILEVVVRGCCSPFCQPDIKEIKPTGSSERKSEEGGWTNSFLLLACLFVVFFLFLLLCLVERDSPALSLLLKLLLALRIKPQP